MKLVLSLTTLNLVQTQITNNVSTTEEQFSSLVFVKGLLHVFLQAGVGGDEAVGGPPLTLVAFFSSSGDRILERFGRQVDELEVQLVALHVTIQKRCVRLKIDLPNKQSVL